MFKKKEKAAKPPKEHCAAYKAVDKFFCLSERGTNIKTEIFAGMLLFFEVICFMMVNAELVSSSVSDITQYYQVYFATIIISAASSVLIGLACNAPFVQSVSLGMSVLIISIYGQSSGLTYANVMAIALVSNLIYFLVMVIKPAREFIFNAIPVQVRKALPAAMGAFLVVYVLVQCNILTLTSADFTGDLDKMAAAGDPISYFGLNYITIALNTDKANWYGYMPVITGLISFALMLVLKAFKRKHATIISFGVGLLIYLIMWVIRGNFMDYYLYAFITPSYGSMYFYDSLSRISKLFNSQLFMSAFNSGFDFSAYISQLTADKAELLGVAVEEVSINGGLEVFSLFLVSALSFLVLGISETGAAVCGSGYISGSLDEEGRYLNKSQPLFGKVGGYVNVYSVNALSSVAGCIMGAGPVVVRPESAVGADEGGKTGLTAIVAGLLFIVALFDLVFSGVFINGMVVYGILIFVGLSMLTAMKNCDFSSVNSALPFLLTVVISAVTLNLATAVAIGIIVDTLVKALSLKFREVKLGTWILTAFMLLVVVLQLTL